MVDVIRKLPIKDQEKLELAMARKQVFESVKPDLDMLSSSVRSTILTEIGSLPLENTEAILKELQNSPASQVIQAINNGAFSTESTETKKKERSGFFNFIGSFFKQDSEQEEVTKYKRVGFSGDVRIDGPEYEGPKFNASAKASQSKASATSHNNSRVAARTNETGGMAAGYGEVTVAASTTKVEGSVSFEGSKIKFRGGKISSND